MTSPQGGVNLGSAYGSISISDNIDAAIGKATQSFDNALSAIGGRMEQLGNRMSDIGGKLTLVAAPLALFGGQGVKAAASFEDALAEIGARASLTADELDVVRETALRMGAETSFSTQQAADSFLNLLTAGLSTEQALATLPSVLTGAAAAGADLGQTANQVTNIMSSFQIEAAEAARIVEVMNQAAGASPAEMSEMGDALAMVGGDARNFGLSLEQTGAILTVFARNGKTGTEAATQLRSILTQMTSGTTDNVRAWEMVGTSLFDASGEARDFGVVLSEIDAGLQNLSAEDQAFVIQQLAGSYGRVGLNALLASDGIEAVIGEMNEQASAADVAEARLDTLNGRFESMMGSIEALQITAFTPFNEWLKTLVERGTELINVFTAWVNTNQDIVQPILKVVSVLLLIGPALLALGPIVSLVGSSLTVLGVAFGALMSPIGLVIAGVAGLAFIFRNRLGSVVQVVRRAVGFIRSAFSILIFRDFKAFGSGLYEDNPIWNFFYDLHDRVAPILSGISHLVRIFVSDIQQFGLGEAIAGIFGEGNVAETMESSLEGALTMMGVSRDRAIEIVNTIWTAIEPIVNAVGSAFDALGHAFHSFTIDMSEGHSIFESLGYAIIVFAQDLGIPIPITEAVRDAIIGIIDTLSDLWAAFEAGGVSGAATFLYDNVFVPMRDSVQNINWSEVGTKIMDALGAAFGLAVNFATWVYDNILMPIWNNVSTAVASVDWGAVGSSIMSALGTAFTTLISWATWIFDNILTPIVTFAGEAIASIDWYGVGAGIVNAIGLALTTVFDFIGWIVNSIFNPVTENAETASGQIDWGAVGNAILNGIGAFLTGVFNFVSWLYENILSPLVLGAADAIAQTNWSAVGQGLMDAIKNALPNIWEWVQNNIITPISNALANFDPMATIRDVGNALMGNERGMSTGSFAGFPRDSGGRGQTGMPYLIGAGAQPELFVPDSAGTFYPNADEMMGGGANFAGAIFNIHANSEAEGREGARGFQAELMELMRST